MPAITLEKDTAETMSGVNMGGNEQDGDTSTSSEGEDSAESGLDGGNADTIAFDAEAKNDEGETETLVHVEAGVGTFPEGTTMEATVVSDQNVIDSITESTEGEVVAVRAVDLTFTDENGETVQPAEDSQVSVTLSAGEGAASDAQNDENSSASAGQKEESKGEEASDDQNTETTVVQYTEKNGAEPIETSDDVSFQVEPETDLDQDNAVSFDMSEQPGEGESQTYAIVETVPDNSVKDNNFTDVTEGSGTENPDAAGIGAGPGTEEVVTEEQAIPLEDQLAEEEEGVLSAYGEAYLVTMTYGPKAGIPKGASLQVEEILSEEKAYDDHLEESQKALNEAAQTETKEEDGIYAGPDKEEEPRFFGAHSLMGDPDAFDRLQAEALSVPESEIVYARFFDITILDADGNDVTPAEPVKVSIELLDTEQDEETIQNADSAQVIHFGEERTELMEAEVLEDTVAGVTFDAEGFSVYGVVYTVDFHWDFNGESFDFSISGGGFVSLYDLVEVLGIKGNVTNSENDGIQEIVDGIESIEFSDPELVSVSKVEGDTTVGAIKDRLGLVCDYSSELTEEEIAEINAQEVRAGDWAFISLKPFDTEESLTVTMKNGDQFVVWVTDAQQIRKVITTSDKILQVTVEVRDGNDIARFEDLRVEELSEDTDAYREAYKAVVSLKGAEDENFDEEKCGFLAADIELLDKDGEAFEPEGTVYVKMELLQLPAEESVLTSTMEIQHLAEQDGKIDVQTVASAENITKVDDVVTAEFSVESFSTFTLTWTDDGSSTVISDQDASTTLNIQNNNGDTYATVTVHYVDTNGNNIQSPFISAVNGTTPVTIDGLLNSEIEGYEYQGAYYSSYTNENEHGDNLTSISASRASEDREVSGYASKSYSTNGYTSSTEFSDRTYYADTALTTQLWWRQRNSNGRWYLYNARTNGSRINQNTVYYANSGTQTYYTTSVTFSGESVIETLVSDATASDAAYETGASIYLVYENTDPGKSHATIHYGKFNNDGTFTELQESVTLDSNAASISMNATISGYEFVGAYYSVGDTPTPAVGTQQISPILRKVDDSWQYSNVNTFEKGSVEDGSHIYVSYKEKTTPVTPTPDDSKLPAPSTIKKVTSNEDGTYDIQLDIIGQQIVETERKGANVLLIFDRTSSMTSSMEHAPGNGQRIDAARAAVHTLVDALDPGNNPVQIAAFSFARFADPEGGPNNYDVIQGINWTESGSAITDFTDGLTLAPSGSAWQTYTYPGGTNWEAALDYANEYLKNPPDDDPTYIIFLTDGNPTIHNGTASTSGSGVINSTPNEDSTEYLAAQTAADNLSKAYKFYGILCANQSDGPLLQTLVTHLNDKGYDATHILGDDSNKLNNSFKDIADYIVKQLGTGDVSTNDGITSLSTVNASVSGAAGAFQYYKAYEVTYENNKYTYVDDNGDVQEIAASQVNTYTYQDSNGNPKTYLYCNRAVWNDAPGASYNEATGVTWDLGSEGILQEGAIYSIRFTIWPSQEAYDLLADLNNGIKVYEAGHENSITDSERDQVYESNGVYYMKTNTNLDTSYSFGGDTYTDSIDYYQGAMDLDTRTISMKKLWPDNLLDDYGPGHSLDGIKKQVTLTVTKDGVNYLDVTLDKNDNWEKDDVYISCGLLTVHNGVVEIKEPGHDYTVVEPGIFSYYWDLIADVYRPMVIGYENDNGITIHEATLLVLDESLTEADNVNSFEIGGKIYKKQNTSDTTLKASNYRRSNLNLKKTVTGMNAPKDALFEYTVKIKDAAGEDIWFSAMENDVYQVLETSSNVTPEYRTVEGAQYNPDDKTYTYTHEGKTYTLFAADDGTGGKMYTGFYSVHSDEEFTIRIKDGWNVRFINLLHNSTFSITESDNMDEGFSFVDIGTRTQYPFSLVDSETIWNTVDGQTITGTIVEPNNSYMVTYTNKWDSVGVLLEKVDEDGAKISGSVFDLEVKGDFGVWTKVMNSIKPGGTETVIDDSTEQETTVTISNPVDLGGLGVGHFRLKETNAPDGYIILTDYTYFEVYKDGSTLKVRLTDESGNPLMENGKEVTKTDMSELSSSIVEGKTIYTITITNIPGVVLPSTGGSGISLFYFLGIMLTGLAGTSLLMLKRRETL